MKKLYILTLALFASVFAFAQGPIITGMMDGDCSGGTPKVLEIYANGTVDFSLYSLENQTNSNDTWANTYDLSAIGTLTDTFVYVYKETADSNIFATEFPSVTNTLDTGASSIINLNGDDRVRIIETATTTVIDQYGVEATDGTDSDWEYKDGYGKRNAGTAPNAGAFIPANWTNANGVFDGQGSCQGGATFESIYGIGTYTPPTVFNPMLAITSPTEAAVLNPEAGTSMTLSFVVQNFVVDVTSGSGDGHVHYSVDGGGTVMVYTTDPIILTGLGAGTHTIEMWLVDNSHTPLDPAVEASVAFDIAAYTQVADLAALRASAADAYYEVTGEVIGTFGQSYHSQKWVQDATAGMKIDDDDDMITTAYNEGDGVTGLKGMLVSTNSGLLFLATADPGVASSTGNVVTPETVTLADLVANIGDYEAELVLVSNATIADYDSGDGTFQTGKNYPLTDASGASTLRTNFYGADYIGEALPTEAMDYVCIVGSYNGAAQVTPRNAADFLTLSVAQPSIKGFALYPNPTKGTLNITTQNNLEKNIQIMDLLGKQVFNVTTSATSINVSNLNAGVYIINIEEAGYVAVRKLVVE